MNKKKRLATLFMLLLCLSACGDNNAVTSDTDTVEEVASEQSDETSDAVDSPEPVEEEPVELVKADEPVNADDETVNEDNEIPELNEAENADETELGKSFTRTECNETVYTNTTSNIRLQPSSTAEKVETVNKGTELLRTATLDNGWSEIQYNEITCYISSKLVDTEPIAEPIVESEPVETASATNETATPAPSTPASSVSNETTRTFSNGITFVVCGQTPKGLPIWCLSTDTEGSWPDYMIAAYDATGITSDMSDYDKAVAINNYICRVVDYAEIGADDRALYCACLAYGQATCVGYSHAFDCLCTMAGVYSNQVTGLADGGAHSWDYVLIGNTKYWVDPTWNDGTGNAYLMSTTLWADHVVGYEK